MPWELEVTPSQPTSRRSRVAAMVALLIVLGAPGSALASVTGWLPPEYLSESAGGGSHIRIAGSASGRAVAVWTGSNYAIWARVYDPGAGWGHPSNIGAGSNPEVVISQLGVATAVWFGESGGILAAQYTGSSGWATAQSISGTGGSTDEILLSGSSSGTVFAAWRAPVAGNLTVNSSLYLPGRGWADHETVPSVLRGAIDGWCAAVDNSGRGYIGWSGWNGSAWALYLSEADWGSFYGFSYVVNGPGTAADQCALLDDDAAGVTLAYAQADVASGNVSLMTCVFWNDACPSPQVVAARLCGGLPGAPRGKRRSGPPRACVVREARARQRQLLWRVGGVRCAGGGLRCGGIRRPYRGPLRHFLRLRSAARHG